MTTLQERLRLGSSIDRDRGNITGFATLADDCADRIDELEAQVAELKKLLLEAADDAEYYAQYAGEYLAKKYGIADEVAKYRDAAMKGTV